MEVFLDDESGASAVFSLQVQFKSSGLGVMLAGGAGRFMLSDSVSTIELAASEFVGRVSAQSSASCTRSRLRRRTMTR